MINVAVVALLSSCVHRTAETVATLRKGLSPQGNLTSIADFAGVAVEELMRPLSTHELQRRAHCSSFDMPPAPLAFTHAAQFESFCRFAHTTLQATGLCINGLAHRLCAAGKDVRLAVRGIAVTGRSHTRTQVWSTSVGNITRHERFDDQIDSPLTCWRVSRSVPCVPLSSSSAGPGIKRTHPLATAPCDL